MVPQTAIEMSFYELRKKFVSIARRDVGKVEASRNRGDWIKRLWPMTNYPEGYADRAPYCAAGVAFCFASWVKDMEVAAAIRATYGANLNIENWRCKSAAAFGWTEWARKNKVKVISDKFANIHTGDIVVYEYSHIEIVVDDDPKTAEGFIAIGYNTDSGASRDGEGCYEKPRSRSRVREFIRVLE